MPDIIVSAEGQLCDNVKKPPQAADCSRRQREPGPAAATSREAETVEEQSAKQFNQAHGQVSYIERLLPRVLAAWAFRRGNIERYRLQRIEQGEPPWQVLRYEHVTNPESKIYPLKRTSYVRPQTFELHLQYLKNECNVISLEELTRALNSGRQLPDKTVAVTFDCGFNDFYTEAAPRLVKYNIPCTVFVPSAYIGTDLIFWPDKIVGALFLLKAHKFEFPNFKEMGRRYYEVLEELGGTGEISLGRAALLVDTLQKMAPEKRQVIMDQLGTMVQQLGGIPIEEQFMKWEQLKELADVGIHFGSMGHGHKTLTEIGMGEFAAELRAAFDTFDKRGLRLRRFFAYPYGKFTKDARELLFQAGFRHSFAIGDYPPPKPSRKRATVIGRTQMFESLSYCKELFACRLWRVEKQVGISR